MPKTVAGKFTGIVAIPELDVADIMLDVIEAMRNDDPFSKAVEIMVVGVQGFSRYTTARHGKNCQDFLSSWYPC
jgi:hypothetical protein